MRMPLSLCASLLLVACGDKGDEGDEATPQITGEIQVNGQDEIGDVAIYKAFATSAGTGFLLYLSNNPDATCATVVDYLRTDEPWDPTGFLTAGSCDIVASISTWDEVSGAQASDDPLGAAGFSINCYFGDETWEYETRDSDDRDYYYQGREWLGSPAAYRYDFAPDGDDYFIDLSMSEYNGQFPYETLESFPASGAVSGTITAERCDTLATTPIFPR
jgi:hypothetical protein